MTDSKQAKQVADLLQAIAEPNRPRIVECLRTGAKNLTFWARGENGGEKVTFKFGIIGPDKKYADSSEGELDDLSLTTKWKQYSIKLAGKDLSRIKTGFAWALNGQGQRIIFYLADIQFE